jgi:pSer/pThr/pTyr-binding forkhead associated (FHA) protein
MDVKLVLFKKDGSRSTFPLPSSVTIVGRRRDCDLRIPLLPVSKRHCELSLNKDTLKVRDLGSRNGTYINGKQIDDEATIRAGDYLTIGPLTFLLGSNIISQYFGLFLHLVKSGKLDNLNLLNLG